MIGQQGTMHTIQFKLLLKAITICKVKLLHNDILIILLYILFIGYLKQKVGCKRILDENDNSTKDWLVLQQVVIVHAQQNGPVFEVLLHSLLPAPILLLYLSGVWVSLHNTRKFYVGLGGALVAPIHLIPLPRLQHQHQQIPENCKVIPHSWGI